MARVRKNDVVCLIGLKLHILDSGTTFNLHTRVASPAAVIAQRMELVSEKAEAAEHATKRGSGAAKSVKRET
jgi:hypothetical protein